MYSHAKIRTVPDSHATCQVMTFWLNISGQITPAYLRKEHVKHPLFFLSYVNSHIIATRRVLRLCQEFLRDICIFESVSYNLRDINITSLPNIIPLHGYNSLQYQNSNLDSVIKDAFSQKKR